MILGNRRFEFILPGFLVLALASCAGTTSTGSSSPATSPLNTDKGSATPKVSQEKPADDQAEKAKIFCEHEIEKSTTQPPDALTRKQIVACLTAIRPDYQTKCGKGIQRSILLKIIVEKSGLVSEAFSIGDSADSPEAECVVKMVKDTKFPLFKASNQQVIQKYKFEIEP